MHRPGTPDDVILRLNDAPAGIGARDAAHRSCSPHSQGNHRLTYPLLEIGYLMVAKSDIHQSHPEIVKRLKRAEGHLRTIIGMIKANRPCVDVAQQLHAVEKAVRASRRRR